MDPESQRQLSSLGLLCGFGSSIWFISCFEVPGAALECKLRQPRFRTSPCRGFCKQEPPSPPHPSPSFQQVDSVWLHADTVRLK